MNTYLYAYTRVANQMVFTGTMKAQTIPEVTEALEKLIPDDAGGEVLIVVKL